MAFSIFPLGRLWAIIGNHRSRLRAAPEVDAASVSRAGIYLVSLFVSVSAFASDLPPGNGFSLPLKCTPGVDCWVMNYPDMAPGPDVKDPTCGPRSYDGHKGTDFAIRDLAAMGRGVPVLAAADGIVRRLRDGVPDKMMRTKADGTSLKGRACGNGMVVDHGNGWQTQYCHLRRGSVSVRPGDSVARGQRLGQVGLSGRTRFPHVHLTIRHGGEILDPMTGGPLAKGCKRDTASLWRADARAAYQPASLYAVGFATGQVTGAAIKRDAASPTEVDRSAPALVLWAAIFGVRAGDKMAFTITDANGKTIFTRAQN